MPGLGLSPRVSYFPQLNLLALTDAFFRMLDSVGGPAVSNGLDSDLGGDAAGGSGGNDTYKVLVLDKPCRDVVSPLIRVADLRKHGVTLHLALEADRQAIPEVAALYFVSPTDSVVRRLGKDLSSSLYASWHLHFCSPLPRPGLEALAGEAVRCEGGVARVARVCDQCLGFVTLEQRLFSLGLPRAFVQLNDPQANDKDIEVRQLVTRAWLCGFALGQNEHCLLLQFAASAQYHLHLHSSSEMR